MSRATNRKRRARKRAKANGAGPVAIPGRIIKRKSLYFAYGSNLHMDQMAARCPGSEPLCKLVLPDWRLVFRGVADVEPCHRDRVEGCLYVITPECEAELDHYEGWPRMYRKEYFLIKHKGEPESVMFYRMNQDTTVAPPYAGYFEVVQTGFEHWGLDQKKLIQAARRSRRSNDDRVASSWEN
jgi:gamma-glutamylcyclotransferase (GGCT)/AIG2-like uncharacterized protein YtfP